jgi:hypothetical protein
MRIYDVWLLVGNAACLFALNCVDSAARIIIRIESAWRN